MKIGIIGAGFAGLAAAYLLAKKGHEIIVLEKDSVPGGLAVGYKEKKWHWPLEKHYHHWFTNDSYALSLSQEIGHEVIVKRPKTSAYVQGTIYQLDSASSLLHFPRLTLPERLRMATLLALLKYNPFWKNLESIKATEFLPQWMGKHAYELIWEPLFLNKFGPYMHDISLAWFWARITKRTSSLAYPAGGFLEFAEHLVQILKKNNVEVLFDVSVEEIQDNTSVTVRYSKNKKRTKIEVDTLIVTISSALFTKIAPELPSIYIQSLAQLKSIGATNLILRLSKQFLTDNTYWLSICDKNSPIMAIVEHTNFMDPSEYNNEHIVYLGNYLPTTNPRFSMDAKSTLKLYDPFLRRINKNYASSLIGYELFKAPFAQPIIPTNYSRMIPSFKTPLPHVFLANIQQVYPWDRGTNYAIELGQKVAAHILREL